MVDIPFITAASSWISRRVFSLLFDSRRERHQKRRDILLEVMGQKSEIYEGALREGLNGHSLLGQAQAIFAGHRPITDALRKLHEQHKSPERLRDNLLTLVKEMAKETRMPLDAYNDDFLLLPSLSEADKSRD